MNKQSRLTAKASPVLGKPAGVPIAPASGASATLPKMPCLSCDGVGEVDIHALDAVRPCIEYCSTCDGTGLVAPYCETCSGKLVDGWCSDCEDYGLSGWLLAEHSALGMAK